MRRYFVVVVVSALVFVEASAAANFVAGVEQYAGDHDSTDPNHQEDNNGQLRRAILAHSESIAQTATSNVKVVDPDDAPEPEFEGEEQQLQGQEPNRVSDTATYNNEDGVDTESVSVQVNDEQVRWGQEDGEVPIVPTTVDEKLLATVSEERISGEDLHANVKTYPHGDHAKKIEQYCKKIAGADGDWYDCDQEPGFQLPDTPKNPPPTGDEDDADDSGAYGAAYTDPPKTEPTPAPPKTEPTPAPTPLDEPTPAPTKPEPTPAATTTTTYSDTSTGTTGGTTTTTQPGTSTGVKGGTPTTTPEGTTTDTASDTVAPEAAANTASTTTSTTTKAGATLSAGGIAGIAIGCTVFVAIVVGAVLFRQKSLARQREENLFTDLGGDYAAMTRMTSSSGAWRASLTLLVAVACTQVSCTAASEQSFLKIQLHKQQQTSAERELANRLERQQERVRRRAQEEIGNVEGDFALGTLSLSESPLGVGYGTHYAEIYLGIPAQRASVIVDTGSHLTALPCSSCDGCGTHTDPLFDVSKSTTAKYLACHDFDSCRSCEADRCYISQSYMEGSMWQAVMVDELVWVGGFSSKDDEMEGVLKTFGFRFPVGCQTKETGLFITQKENGIMGLGRHRSTVMSYMLNAGRITHNLFTLCFAGDGGELVFGGVDYSHHTSNVGYTPLLNDNSAYYPVHVKDILLNGVSLGIEPSTINSGRGIIVDSGTTDTFFDAKGQRSFMSAFKKAAGRDYSEKRMKLTTDELAALPTISVILSGMKGDGTDDVQLDVPGSQYLTVGDDDGSYYGNFHFSERSGGVLGASTMVGYDVIFDTEHKRIGFAQSDCGKDYTNSSSEEPIASDEFAQPESESASSVNADTTERPVANTSTPVSSNNSSTESNTTAAALADAVGGPEVIASSSTDVETKRSSPAFGAFIAEIILISLVGIALAVMVWTKWRTRAWSRIPDAAETSRAQMQTIVDIIESESPSPVSPRSRTLSPRSRAARKGPSPKFTIGSSGEEDADEFREEEGGVGSPAIAGRTQGTRSNI